MEGKTDSQNIGTFKSLTYFHTTMFFKKKPKEESVCPKCKSEIAEKYSFCPWCGLHLINPQKELKEFGMLGRSDIADDEMIRHAFASNMSMADKFIGSLMNSVLKNIDMQIREVETTEVKSMPNGIRIRVGAPVQQRRRESKMTNRQLTEQQLTRMSKLPRSEAKTNVRRLADKVVYDLTAQGIESEDDVFVSKTESGYEIKAIAKNKVYVNSVPVNLPLRGFSLHDKGLTVEFGLK